ncbi:glycosyltransferase family 39 protein [Streptomyces sp. MB09-01]|uniref:ArnT family glycosyltransferase n=1 Tax=Streptomyces sp. MB09-01 TaxID=3028666 RepID=UPI0029AC6A9D|nr:glycosyltransferase family 39 protein [Streptomyces sp. MB09-01]MDX3535342.1 glycosyltransferase family 39 protein [Streptomyces sp. MB09-01]
MTTAATPLFPASEARARTGRRAADRPRWERPALAGLLFATAALLLWDLGSSGYANSFYSAAVQAGSESWKAFFFGSSDAGNSITVDKPPAALWPMMLSVRLFGLGSWQILVPQALMGVGTTAVLYAAVRRQFGPGAALLSGAAFALTPVAALMFRFNNPDALLTLLLTVTVYCVLRALDGARTNWLVWAGVAVGFAFLTKTLQAFVILPPLALLYAVCAPTRLRRRLGQLLLAGLAMVAAGGWWVAIVELWPASSRPYIGGSQNDSFLELTLGYNGLGRINGNESGSVGGGARTGTAAAYGLPEGGPGGGAGGGGWGQTGFDRLFSGNIGGQISWLLPAALVLLVAGLVVTWRARRATDSLDGMARAAFLAWGGSLLITAIVFSYMQGIFHEYYTVALAPFVAALIGMGVAVLWEERGTAAAAIALSGTLALTAVWSYVLLGRATGYLPWLRWAVLVGGLLAAAALPFAARAGRRMLPAVAALGVAAALAGPLAYCLTTVSTGHTGSIVTAGPAVAGGRGGPGGMMGGFRAGAGEMPRGGPGGQGGQGTQDGQPGGGRPNGVQQDGSQQGGGQPGGGQPGGALPQGGTPPGQGVAGGRGGMRAGGGPGGAGGLLNGAQVGAEAKAALTTDADAYTWAAAAIGSQNAASYQLASGAPVMAIGGFNGSDPSPTLEQFKRYVREGKIHWFIGQGGTTGTTGGPGTTEGGARGGGAGGGTSSEIESWVKAGFKASTVGGATFYDLTAPTA